MHNRNPDLVGENRFERIFQDREINKEGGVGPLTSYAKKQLHDDEIIEFNPNVYLPDAVIEELTNVSSLNKIFYSDHALERVAERGMPCFHRLNFADCHAGQIDHRKSEYRKHHGTLLKDDSFKVEIEKVKATYDPIHGKTDVVRMNVRIKGIVGMGDNEEENQNPKNQLDAILVLDVKRGKKGGYVGVAVTGWMKAGDDYPPRHNYAVENDFHGFINKMEKGYRITKKKEIQAKREQNIKIKEENKEKVYKTWRGDTVNVAHKEKNDNNENSKKHPSKKRGMRRKGYSPKTRNAPHF